MDRIVVNLAVTLWGEKSLMKIYLEFSGVITKKLYGLEFSISSILFSCQSFKGYKRHSEHLGEKTCLLS